MSENKNDVLSSVQGNERTGTPINLDTIKPAASEVLQAAALNDAVASELEAAAAHFEKIGEMAVAWALREQARNARTAATRLRTEVGSPEA